MISNMMGILLVHKAVTPQKALGKGRCGVEGSNITVETSEKDAAKF